MVHDKDWEIERQGDGVMQVKQAWKSTHLYTATPPENVLRASPTGGTGASLVMAVLHTHAPQKAHTQNTHIHTHIRTLTSTSTIHIHIYTPRGAEVPDPQPYTQDKDRVVRGERVRGVATDILT